MMLLLCLLCSLWAEPSLSLKDVGVFPLDEDIRDLAVGSSGLYIATEERLYQLSHDLKLVRTLTQKGIFRNGDQQEFQRVSGAAAWETTFRANMLLPFVKNGSLISCGAPYRGCGYCEVLDLQNISNLLYRENIQVGPLSSSSGSVGFLLDVKKDSTQTETYILTAVRQHEDESKKSGCNSDTQTINLHNTDDAQEGEIFSLSVSSGKAVIRSKGDVEFVDGFQIDSTAYLLSNVRSGAESNRVRLIWLQAENSKAETVKTLRGATLRLSDGGSCRLLAASLIPGGQQVLWSGVFGVDGTNTELAVFDISPDGSVGPDNDPDFFYASKGGTSEPKTLKPKALLFRQHYMTSVLAVRQKAWMVFFIGTADGQLIKLVVDRNFHPACPRVLYRANDDRKVFPKMHLDPVDPKHMFVAFRKQMRRVPVAACSSHTDVQQCWSAQDPFCVWCSSKSRCTFEDDCRDSDWLSIPEESQQKMVSHRVVKDPDGPIKLIVQIHVTAGQNATSNFACQFSTTSKEYFSMKYLPQFPQCTCTLLNGSLPADGVRFTVKMRLGTTYLSENLRMINCSEVHGPPSSALCQQCIEAGCGWSNGRCSWAHQGLQNVSVCQEMESGTNLSKPEISSITPSVVSFYGRNHALLSGRNLSHVTRVRIQKDMDCSPRESPVWNNTGASLTFHIPATDTKGGVKVCVLLPDGSCHGSSEISYKSSPVCSSMAPNSSWISGKRKVTLTGSHLELVEGLTHSHALQEVLPVLNSSFQELTYETAANTHSSSSTVSLKVANHSLACPTHMMYYPDPEFTSFTSAREGDDIRITFQKKTDKLQMSEPELLVWGVQDQELHPCIMEGKESSNNIESFICEIRDRSTTFQQIQIKYGDKTVTLNNSSLLMMLWMLIALLLIPCIIVVVVIVSQRRQKKLTAKMNKVMEDLELDIRNDIRQGFVDLQTDKAELMENVGAIPFLDYKHFASRIFFPESEPLMTLYIKDIGQDAVKDELDECSRGLSKLMQDQLFLTSMVHALEEQKSFTIKDKCALASLLTVALHSDLLYLTEVMEVLLKDLMQQNSSAQPKLLLRRTESTVEKLLTNWMSICLYGFLRESAGQQLFLMVSALAQHIAKGPVDSVTEKALYTLSEDWLLWQAQDFSSLRLKVLFAVGTDGEVSEPLEVDALSCDTVEQLKEKILSTFKAKFGFPYNAPLRDVCVEYERDGLFVPLQEVDANSEVVMEVTMLNTLQHYKVHDGATIKVLPRASRPPLSPQGSVKDDENFSGKYFHLINPDVYEDQRSNPERKKFKLKEVHLTKLLSTKIKRKAAGRSET
ncbi:plexin-C1 isoform 2-T2 [Odontesthes bonariensis]|uniref:plexin-C1 isoform X2 n=1 Tax=Odontesthes bonariensis TaxID=219752 RepID=UPI003F589187